MALDAIAPVAPRGETRAEERLAAMVTDHFAFIWRLLRRLGVPADRADDAAQEVFVVASARVADIAIGSERSFLFGTARRVAAAVRRERVSLAPDEPVDVRDPAPGPEDLAHQKRARDLLDSLLDAMDQDLRTAFVLYEVEGLSVAEIADVAGIPLGTVASRLRRAREEFEALLKRAEARRAFRGGAR